MAVRLRGLTGRCIFCTFSATRSLPLFQQRLPRTVNSVRFRTSKSKPGARVLSEIRQRPPGKSISVFELNAVVSAALEKIKPPLLDPPHQLYNDDDTDPSEYYHRLGKSPAEIHRKFRKFASAVAIGARESGFSDHGTFLVTKADIEAAIDESPHGLRDYLMRKFLDYIGVSPRSVEQEARVTNLKKAADLRFPQEWYPGTRQFQRTWYLHVGPTNSGKTYHALKRLTESGSGCYAGPLRLLAHEVFERMNTQGTLCNLVTGDDRKMLSELAQLTSCTVEMVDLNKPMEVCVLDEIQMIGDRDRGWAWTQALLGVKAKEVHLCGEERTVELIQNLAATMGEKLVIRHYKRLGPLEMMPKSLDGDLHKLERGDCIVTFSRKTIFAIQREIEATTGKKCAVIYGSLPPETRSLQAKLFNDPNNDYEILVASDAVGMGLNLSVKRMIFETTVKWDGTNMISVSIPAIKQIAGRAGRFRVAGASTPSVSATDIAIPLPAAPSIGYVTTLEREHHSALAYAMNATPNPLKTAGILPSTSHIEEFSALFPPHTPFHEVLEHLKTHTATTPSLFHICSFNEHLKVARALSYIKGLSVAERLQFCMAPITSDFMVQDAAVELAQRLADNLDGSVLAITALDLDILDIENPTRSEELRRLEGLHKALLLYLWLSWRFPATFAPRETAQDLKVVCEGLIDLALKNIKTSRKKLVMNEAEKAKIFATPAVDAEIQLDEDDDDDDDDEEEEEEEEEIYEGPEEEEDEGEEEGESVVPRAPPEMETDNVSEFVPKEPLQESETNIRESP